ncbi:MAG: hypothetical protein F2663_04890 [Actinobacteria bacterium]|uniref:Unannotated protein n=1 Tax=freshwater metagenome TaxID=449393 RepID=A0A6J6P990_9ZZZZ|nr:hypothetical protein [Actinomycetota bacterium]
MIEGILGMQRMRMYRRTLSVAATALLTMLALASPAAAKHTLVTVTSSSLRPHAGVAWKLNVTVKVEGRLYARAGYRPKLSIVNASGVPIETFSGTPIGPGRFRVDVLFPRSGTWRYVVADPISGEWWFNAVRVDQLAA